MSLIEITSLLCKIIGIQSEIIKRQSEALEVVNVCDAEEDVPERWREAVREALEN